MACSPRRGRAEQGGPARRAAVVRREHEVVGRYSEGEGDFTNNPLTKLFPSPFGPPGITNMSFSVLNLNQHMF